MLGFEPVLGRAFLQAYRERRDLSLDELDVAAHCYGTMRAYDLWLFEEIYDRGNDRARRFVKPGDFALVEAGWRRLRGNLEHA